MTADTPNESIAREIVQLVREASDLNQVFVSDEHFARSHVTATAQVAKIITAALAAKDEERLRAVEAEREGCAKLCDEPINHQHPLKPAGVIMSVTPASPAHAIAIRARKEKPDG